MSALPTGIIGFLLIAVVLILILGFINMMRGGNPNRAQKLMRWRVLLQFGAVIVMFILFYGFYR